MKTTKHLATSAAAIALVSALGLAYAQSNAPETNPNAPAAEQQTEAQQAVNQGTTATPDWRPQDLNAVNDSTATTATPAPADQSTSMDSSTPAPANQDTTPAPTDATAMTPDTSAATPSTDMSSTTTPAPSSDVITERAPRADRN